MNLNGKEEILQDIIRKDKAFDYTTSTEKPRLEKSLKLKQRRGD